MRRLPTFAPDLIQGATPKTENDASKWMNLSGSSLVKRVLQIYLVLFASFWIVAISGTYLKVHRQGKPFGIKSMFFKNADMRFNDFVDFDPVDEQYKSYTGVKGQNYPPPLICVLLFFTRTFHHKPLHEYLLALLTCFAVFTIGWAVVLYRSCANGKLLAFAAIVTVIAGYPFIFEVERGNTEWVIFALNGAALAAFFLRRHFTAGLLIAVAASMKIFPALLFALLLARKRYWEVAVSAILIIPLQIVSLWVIGPTIPQAMASVQTGLTHLSNAYFSAYGVEVIGYDHSLFSLVKQVLHVGLRGRALDSVILSITPWYTLLAAIGVPVLYWFWIRKLPLLNQTAVLIILAVGIPYVSFNYTLTNMYLVWMVFAFYLSRDVSEGLGQIPLRAAAAILALLAFLYSPSAYIAGNWQVYGGQVQALAMIALAGIFLTVPMKCRALDS